MPSIVRPNLKLQKSENFKVKIPVFQLYNFQTLIH